MQGVGLFVDHLTGSDPIQSISMNRSSSTFMPICFDKETLSPKKSYEENCWNGNNNKKNKRKFPSYHIEIIYGSQKNSALQQKAE
jgi:hypothetical protein